MTPFLIFLGTAFAVSCAIVIHAYRKAPLIEDPCEPSGEMPDCERTRRRTARIQHSRRVLRPASADGTLSRDRAKLSAR